MPRYAWSYCARQRSGRDVTLRSEVQRARMATMLSNSNNNNTAPQQQAQHGLGGGGGGDDGGGGSGCYSSSADITDSSKYMTMANSNSMALSSSSILTPDGSSSNGGVGGERGNLTQGLAEISITTGEEHTGMGTGMDGTSTRRTRRSFSQEVSEVTMEGLPPGQVSVSVYKAGRSAASAAAGGGAAAAVCVELLECNFASKLDVL